jgi:hypothetical protein
MITLAPTTETDEPVNLTPAAARAKVLEALADAMSEDSQFRRRFVAIVKCRAAGLEDKDDVLFTSIKMRHSAYEYGTKVSLGIKLDGGDLTSIFKTRKHYVTHLRVAPRDPDTNPVNLKLDGDIASILVVCEHIGKQSKGTDGTVSSVVNFSQYDGEDGTSTKATLAIAVEGEFLTEAFELGQVYRLAVLPAPKWLEEDDKLRRKNEAADKAAKLAAKERKGQPPIGTQKLPFMDPATADQVLLENGQLVGAIANDAQRGLIAAMATTVREEGKQSFYIVRDSYLDDALAVLEGGEVPVWPSCAGAPALELFLDGVFIGGANNNAEALAAIDRAELERDASEGDPANVPSHMRAGGAVTSPAPGVLEHRPFVAPPKAVKPPKPRKK